VEKVVNLLLKAVPKISENRRLDRGTYYQGTLIRAPHNLKTVLLSTWVLLSEGYCCLDGLASVVIDFGDLLVSMMDESELNRD